MMVEGLELQVGEFYRRGDEVVGPATPTANRHYPFRVARLAYTAQGAYLIDGDDHSLDLVEHIPINDPRYPHHVPESDTDFIGEGWRRLEPDELLKEGDQYYGSDGIWHDSCQYKSCYYGQQNVGFSYRRRIEPKPPQQHDTEDAWLGYASGVFGDDSIATADDEYAQFRFIHDVKAIAE
jgi:hypothetical protein